MQFFINTYQSHDVTGVIVFSCVMGLVALSILGGTIYIYCTSPPVQTVDPVLGDLNTGQATELRFIHSNTTNTINCVFEESFNPNVVLILMLLCVLLLLFWYRTRILSSLKNIFLLYVQAISLHTGIIFNNWPAFFIILSLSVLSSFLGFSLRSNTWPTLSYVLILLAFTYVLFLQSNILCRLVLIRGKGLLFFKLLNNNSLRFSYFLVNFILISLSLLIIRKIYTNMSLIDMELTKILFTYGLFISSIVGHFTL